MAKRTRKGKAGRGAAKGRGPARKDRPARRARKAARPARRPAPARRRSASRPGDGRLIEGQGERQLADPVEVAQEDLRALPEQPLFDRDRSGRDDDLAELLGEEYVRSVTSGEEQGVELRDEPVDEEAGGPFVETSAKKEFGFDADDSEPEPLPTSRRPASKLLR